MRLEDLINEFFEITRFNLTHLTLEKETVNLSRMLEQITFEFTPALEEKGLFWELSIAPDVELLCDPDKLMRVFDNLLKNAVNYSYPNTAVCVSLEKSPTGRVSGSEITERRSQRRSWNGFLSSFSGWIPPAPALRAERGWGLRSQRRSQSCTGAGSRRRARTKA